MQPICTKIPFMTKISMETYLDYLQTLGVKFDRFSIVMARRAYKMHICIFFFHSEWLSSDDLHIGDCKFFLGYRGNLSFTYLLTIGNLVQAIQCQSINVIHHKLNSQASGRSQVMEDDDHCTMLRRSKRRKLQASDNEF